MKIKKHEKMSLINCNWVSEKEREELKTFIGDSTYKLITNHTLLLEKTNVFISYILNLNTFNIIIGDKTFYTNRIQDLFHYFEKEFIYRNR